MEQYVIVNRFTDKFFRYFSDNGHPITSRYAENAEKFCGDQVKEVIAYFDKNEWVVYPESEVDKYI